MPRPRWLGPRFSIPALVASLILIAVACGGAAATPVVVEKEVIKEVVREVVVEREVIKEVPKEVVVEKEVVKEVIREVVVVATPESAAVPPPSGAQGNYGGILNNAHRRWPPSFDSSSFGTADVHSVTAPATNGLLRGVHPFYTSFEGELAKSWEIKPNGKEITFILWPSIKTHNGHTFTSDDAKWSLERLRDDDTLNSHALVGVEINRVDVIDDQTFTVFLEEPSGVFVPKLSPPQQVMYDQQEFIDHDPTGTEDIAGTGPFRLTEVAVKEVVRFERFEDYFEEGKPFFEGVNIFIIRDPATRLAALQAGELDILNVANATGITTDMWEAAADNTPGVVWHRGIHFGGRGVNFNSRREGPWHDKRVRQAINRAINRENASKIPAAVGPGGFVAPTGNWNIPLAELWDKAPGWMRGSNKAKDISQAKALLAEAGFGEGDLTINAMTRDIADYSLYHGPFMVEELRQIGIKVNLEVVESAQFVQRRKDLDYDVVLDNTSGTAIDDPDFIVSRFLCGSKNSRSGYCNEAWDKLALRQRTITDPVERKAVVREMLDILWDDLWVIPVWWAGRHPGYRDWVVNPPILEASGQQVSASRFQHSWFTRERISKGP